MSWSLSASRQICLRCEYRYLFGARPLSSIATGSTRKAVRPISRNRVLSRAADQTRAITSSSPRSEQQSSSQSTSHDTTNPDPPPLSAEQIEALVRDARNRYGAVLPEGLLDDRAFGVYQRLYGAPTRFLSVEELNEENSLAAPDHDNGMTLLRIDKDGMLQEVQVQDDEVEDHRESKDMQDDQEESGLTRSERAARDITMGEFLGSQQTEVIELEEDEGEARQETEDDLDDPWPSDPYTRTHPVTLSGRWGTSPSTLQIPKATFTQPISSLLSNVSRTHLIDVAERSFGGPGLPYSASSPRVSKTMEQKPIGLSAFNDRMKEMEADVYCATIMPQTYASITSILVEVRKRMGSAWMKDLLEKPDGPLILDAGAGGAGVLAWREILRAEWEAMHEDEEDAATIVKKEKPAIPYGKATVVTASDVLRHRAAKLLENTSFIPRIPDFVDPTERTGSQPRKQYDIVIASHAMWRLEEHFQRKLMTETLWSLLNPNGGILILLEKGVPRGFEVIASAREHLLKRHITSPEIASSIETDEQPTRPNLGGLGRFVEKEKGMIIAPCTNHVQCPLYKYPGISRGRKDWCHFTQRYIRPPFLQTILGAKARNHDDVEFSYVAVMRGRDLRGSIEDLRNADADAAGELKPVVQGKAGSDLAFEGYGPPLHASAEAEQFQSQADDAFTEDSDPSRQEIPSPPAPNSLSLPRALLTPIKRKGHILMDLCTPQGNIERWLINRRCGKLVYRDARKSKWGDLWGLGAYSRSERRVDLGVPENLTNKKKERNAKSGKGKARRWARKGKEAMRVREEGNAAEDMLRSGMGGSAKGKGQQSAIRMLEELIEGDDEGEREEMDAQRRIRRGKA